MLLPTTSTIPDHSICHGIQIRIHYETESRFDQIKYGLTQHMDNFGDKFFQAFSFTGAKGLRKALE